MTVLIRLRFLAGMVSGLTLMVAMAAVPHHQQQQDQGVVVPKVEFTATELVKLEAASKRVPPYFGQVALTPEQRAQIQAIQMKYLREILKREKEIEALKEKSLQECEGVLVDFQLGLIKNLRDAKVRRTGNVPKEPTPSVPKGSSDVSVEDTDG
ncbi:hypothetical protein [Isosphaera pallida]|uniref:hypothetical protein n=1 Tax=Isosphaera pallida TaxID=128 RepID=UPI0011D2536A|nr:hypothetical protein [Isosphaera pallida]